MLSAKTLAIGGVKRRALVSQLDDVIGEHAAFLAAAAWPLASAEGTADDELTPCAVFGRGIERVDFVRRDASDREIGTSQARAEHLHGRKPVGSSPSELAVSIQRCSGIGSSSRFSGCPGIFNYG